MSPHWRTMQDNDNRYVAAFELKDKDVTLRIKEVKSEELSGPKSGKKRKLILYFEGAKKPYASGTTTNKTIAGMYGSDANGWVGKLVTLYPTTCTSFGEDNVECIRIRPIIPSAASVASGE